MGTAYRTDPLLRVIDPEEMPYSFLALTDEEQRWRGRLFIAVFWMSHHKAYSWTAALSAEPVVATEWRQVIEHTPDSVLLDRWRAATVEKDS